MKHGPGIIVVPCQELARYHRFTDSLANIEKPEGSHVEFGVGMSVVDNLNFALRERMRPEDEWAWIVGDDHIFDPDTLMRLLDRNEDIISALCVNRMPPFATVHYAGKIAETDYYRTLKMEDLPSDGEPFEVEASGSLMLIRRRVLDAIGDPWYGHTHWRISEDIYFCEKAREAGFRIMVDPEVLAGHIGNYCVVPVQRDGVWGIFVDFYNGFSQFYPGGLDANDAALGKLEPALA